MKLRITALALAAALALGLAACGAPAPQEPDPSPSVEATLAPATPSPEVTVPPSESAEPEESAPPSESAEPQETPTVKPTEPAIGDPTAPPVEEPSGEPEPSDTPSIATPTAAGLRELFMTSSSQSDAPTADFSNMADYLENFYNLSKDDLEDFVFYMPDMSTALQEFFLAKAKPGKVDAVKTACESRLAGLKEEAEFYAGTADFVDTAKVETVGDWVILAVCPEADRVAKIVEDATK